MADVRLHRADAAPAALVGVLGVDGGQRGDLDRVAERGTGAVRLDVADAARVDAGQLDGLGDGLHLPVDAGGGEADLPGAVVVDRVAEHDRADGVAVGDRVGEPLEQRHAHAAAPHRAVRSGVERPAPPVRRGEAVHAEVADVRQLDVDAAGQGHVALAVAQRLAGQVERHQGGGAGGVHCHAGPAQVQPVRHVGGHVVRRVAGGQRDRAVRVPADPLVAQHVAVHVRVAAGAGVHAHRAVVAARVVAGVLQRGVAGLQEQPVLRVGDLGLAGGHPEQAGVELVVAVHERGTVDPARVVDLLRLGAAGELLLAGQLGRRLHAVDQVAPELVDVGRAGEAGGEPDDGDGLDAVVGGNVVLHGGSFIHKGSRHG